MSTGSACLATGIRCLADKDHVHLFPGCATTTSAIVALAFASAGATTATWLARTAGTASRGHCVSTDGRILALLARASLAFTLLSRTTLALRLTGITPTLRRRDGTLAGLTTVGLLQECHVDPRRVEAGLGVLRSATGAGAAFTGTRVRLAAVATFPTASASTIVNCGDRTVIRQAARAARLLSFSTLLIVCVQHQGGA